MPTEQDFPGLFNKYLVTHMADGSTLADCFVLRPTRDPAARAAIAAYAQHVWAENPELAADLHTWLGGIYGKLARGSAEFPMPVEVAKMRQQYELELEVPQYVVPLQPPGNARVDACQSAACRAPVFFARLLKKDNTIGKATPVDWPPKRGFGHLRVVMASEPVTTGLEGGVGADGELLYDGKPVVRQTTDEERHTMIAQNQVLYTGHFATCPDAERFRGA